ncbi:MAG: YlxR family protein [Calditrichaeota bacterium]|nr:MAG: YlxR family protein [Calditrichota bacterium]
MRGHQPVRTCIGCRRQRLKRDLLRIVRTPGGAVEIDADAKKPGRGAYLCYDLTCFKLAVKRKAVSRSLGLAEPANFLEELNRILHDKNRQGAADS